MACKQTMIARLGIWGWASWPSNWVIEKARAQGKDRARLGDALIEVPVYAAAKRLLESDGQS